MWACVSVARFLVSPALVVAMLCAFHHVGLIQDPANDPILWFISILQGCMPSAQNLVLMLQVANKPEQSGSTAKFLFFVYATSMVPVVIIVGMALQQFGLA
jgi:predicted permease